LHFPTLLKETPGAKVGGIAEQKMEKNNNKKKVLKGKN